MTDQASREGLRMTKKQQMQIALLNGINKNRTQGAWTCDYDDNGFYAVTAKEAPFTSVAFTPREGDEAEADAAFIANAPKMLEIINELQAALTHANTEMADLQAAYEDLSGQYTLVRSLADQMYKHIMAGTPSMSKELIISQYQYIEFTEFSDGENNG